MTRKIAIAAGLAMSIAATAYATNGFQRVREILTGYEEVPAVSTAGNGKFDARIYRKEQQIDWALSYADLQGDVQQAHIHLAQKGVNGGITVFLCTNLGNGPVGTQPCPASPSRITGSLIPADISPNIPATQAARNQGLNTGEWEEFLGALRAGALYVNVHTTTWPGGEIRKQLDGSGHGH